MTKFYLTLCCLLTAFAPAAAQQLTGVMTDNNGEPLFGAVAALKGKTAATTTGVRGEYALQGVDLRRDTLVFTYVGMKKLEVPVAGRTKVDVRLEVMNTAINEVVVIGYGTMRRADLTGAVSSVSSEEIVRTPVNNIAEAISGKLAGVQVLTTDGAPDAEVSMYVRGRNSITQSSSPLYIVDGFPVSSISDISPSDIQSIDVLKDASSTAIYGSRGANGVIMVTTKSARQNGVKVSFNAYAGLKYVTPMPDMLDPYEYALWQYEQSVYRNSVSSMYEPYFGVYEDMHLYKNYAGNDWKKIVFGRSATTQNYNVALTGKGDKMTYSASYTRQMDDAVMITSDFVRDNFTFKFQHKPSRKVTLDFQSRFSDTKISGSGANEQSGGRSSDPRMRYVMQYSPIPLKGLSAEGFDDDEFYKNSGLFTPTEYIRDNDRIQKRRNLALSGGFSWTIAKNLVFRSNLNLEFNWNENQRFFGITTYYARMNSVVKDHPAIELTNTDSRRISNYNTLSYDFKDLLPKKHRLNILVGQELNTSKSRTLTADIDGFPVTFSARQAFRFTTEGTAVSTNNFYATPDNLLSFFTRINYSYDDRYLVTGTLRADGSSKFQKSQPWGYFPSGAVAWRISEEPFLKEAEWLSQLKLRASIGLAGNDNIPGGQTLAEYTSDNTQLLPFETPVSYWSQGKYMTNPDLVWETTVSRNVGLDFGFFNNRLNGNLDLYLNTTHDQLILFPIKGAGYTHQYRNMGSTQNKGIELALNAVLVDRRDYSLQFSFNIAMNRNKVLDLGGLDRIEAYFVGLDADRLRLRRDAGPVAGTDLGLRLRRPLPGLGLHMDRLLVAGQRRRAGQLAHRRQRLGSGCSALPRPGRRPRRHLGGNRPHRAGLHAAQGHRRILARRAHQGIRLQRQLHLHAGQQDSQRQQGRIHLDGGLPLPEPADGDELRQPLAEHRRRGAAHHRPGAAGRDQPQHHDVDPHERLPLRQLLHRRGRLVPAPQFGHDRLLAARGAAAQNPPDPAAHLRHGNQPLLLDRLFGLRSRGGHPAFHAPHPRRGLLALPQDPGLYRRT